MKTFDNECIQMLDSAISEAISPEIVRDLQAVRAGLTSATKSEVCRRYAMGIERLTKLLGEFGLLGVQGIVNFPRKKSSLPTAEYARVYLDRPEKARLKNILTMPSGWTLKEIKRVSIVLAAHEHPSYRKVARECGCDHKTVISVIRRYSERGLDGLRTRASGRSAGRAEATRAEIFSVRQRLSESFRTVTDAQVAEYLGLSPSYVQRLSAWMRCSSRRQRITIQRLQDVAIEVNRTIEKIVDLPLTINSIIETRCQFCLVTKLVLASTLIYNKGKCWCNARKKRGIHLTESAVLDEVQRQTGTMLQRNVRPDFLYEDSGVRLEVDAICMKKKLVVEYQGEQHFLPVRLNGMSWDKAIHVHERTVRYDRIKKDICEKRGFKFVEIGPLSYRRPEELKSACSKALADAGIPTRF